VRRFLALLVAASAVALPASAGAAVTPTRNADVLAGAMATSGTRSTITAASLPALPPAGNPAAVADGSLGGFPTDGPSFAILSSGDAAKADPANTSIGDDDGGTPDPAGPRPSVYDLTTLELDASIPAGVNCALFSFRFATDEEPANGSFNDGFIAELDNSNWTTTTSGDISAPNNFAFDAAGNVISVNSPGSTGLTAEQAAGTGFASATARLTAATPVTPGRHSFFFSIFDQGDDVVDSAVLLDGLDLQSRPAADCVRGAQDEIPPAVTLTDPANGTTTTDDSPTFDGTAGEAAGDADTVSVEISAGGTLVQTLTATRTGTAWSVDAAPLAAGDYLARALQTDAAGNTGVSATSAFTVAPDVPDQPDLPVTPVPVLGKSVVAGVVSGKVRFKTKHGKFHTLGAGKTIPLGSTVDATKGRVRITSAAGAGKTQTGDFYQGAFVITQTKGKKPITQLALSGKLSCGAAGKASAAAKKKKVRRLWGDGHGSFRTKGRSGAATVRGTKWLTEDRCNGTLVRVKRGVVQVRDFAKRKTVTVKKGHSYLARAKFKVKKRH
jgi:Bacterial Ig-like domain